MQTRVIEAHVEENLDSAIMVKIRSYGRIKFFT